MRYALLLALAACSFDGRGVAAGDDVVADAGGVAPDAATEHPDGHLPAPTPDAMPTVDCNFDGLCDPGEDPNTCFDCSGGFVCNYDGTCEDGEDPSCSDCITFDCNFDGICDPGEDPSTCFDCQNQGGNCNFNGHCEPNEDPQCVDCM